MIYLYSIIPFLSLLFGIIFFKKTLYGFSSGIIGTIIALSLLKKQSVVTSFFNDVVPTAHYIITPSNGFLYPILFLFFMSWCLLLFKEMNIMKSYQLLIGRFFSYFNYKGILDIAIISSSPFFFLDDYLYMTGVKNFFYIFKKQYFSAAE